MLKRLAWLSSLPRGSIGIVIVLLLVVTNWQFVLNQCFVTRSLSSLASTIRGLSNRNVLGYGSLECAKMGFVEHEMNAIRTAWQLSEVYSQEDLFDGVVMEEEEADSQHSISLRVRFGINSASCLVGNVGSRHRLIFTALGDGVNTSRLEGINKIFKTDILVGEATFLMGREFVMQWMDGVQIIGKSRGIDTYAFVGLRENASRALMLHRVQDNGAMTPENCFHEMKYKVRH